MKPFVRIFTDLYPVTLIESVNLETMADGQPGVEVKLRDVTETFQYTEDYARVATDVLNKFVPEYLLVSGKTLIPSDLIVIGKDTFNVLDIEWINLNASFNGVTGVEVRLSTDGEDINKCQVTRQYTGDLASAAWDLLSQLAPETASTGGA